MNPLLLQWIILIAFGLAFFFLAPMAKSVSAFFSAADATRKQPGIFLLTSSLVISWIFAKSITNAANLGLQFGIVGGVSYAVYYLSFIVAGIVIYQLRVKGGFNSIHKFLLTRFGRKAVIVFSILVAFRLFNEVWSNTMVIGSYFGEAGSGGYYAAILVFTGLTLAYTLKGGLRSSLLTDAIQMVFFGILLVILLGFILQKRSVGLSDYLSEGSWTMSTGLNLFFAALLQVFSYPFHDSVMTDRGFISDPKTTLRSFFYAAAIGVICLIAFSFVGIFARMEGLTGQAAVEVSKMLGVAAMLAMNFIMITSAASTLDSTFSSFSKLIVVDLGKQKPSVKKGRLVMLAITLAGTIPVFLNPEILSATTVSGTMVMGLAPVFLLWNSNAPALSFHLSVGAGIAIGVLLATGMMPKALIFFEGKYGDLLSANLWGIVLCFVLFLIPILMQNGKRQND
ncbi:MAG TPA: sodium:solute symporter [Bacteroidetes bacterium]|nr:sodium:solute symporter [Bacteroidota bacterium]